MIKLSKRNTHSTIEALNITSPAAAKDGSGRRTPLLGFIDKAGNQTYLPTTPDIFMLAAGQNLEGELPDGLDRLKNHRFLVRVDDKSFVVGLDFTNIRQYSGRLIPESQDRQTLDIQMLCGGKVFKVVARPHKVRPEVAIALLNFLDSHSGKLEVGTALGGFGTITSVGADRFELQPTGKRGSRPMFDDPLSESAE